MYPGPWDGENHNMALGRSSAKAIWDTLHNDYWDDQNMNKILVTIFLTHLDSNLDAELPK